MGLLECTIRDMTNRTDKNGICREQASLLPPRMDDYVGLDNPVRAIDAYVRSLDMAGLGFKHGKGGGGGEPPPDDPGDVLKMYLYGYHNQVRSSRRLEREAGRNVEVMWLLGGLAPGYPTIGDFPKDNRAALQLANREVWLLAP